MTHVSALERHRIALARSTEIALDGIRRLEDVSVVCTDMLVQLEKAEPELFISVMTLDRERGVLRTTAAPRLPTAYLKAVDGVAIAPGLGSCGAAAAEDRQVFVSDIFEHENWKNFRELAELTGMRACWSTPIHGAHGDVIGTFAVYHADTGLPSKCQVSLIEGSAQILGIVLDCFLTQSRLQTALTRLEFATEAGGIGIWDWDKDSDRLMWDDRMLALYGLERESFTGRFDDFVHQVDPEDARRIQKEGSYALAANQRYQCEFTITRARDGARRRIAEYCAPHRDPQTGAVHLIGVDWDVTEQREREEQLRQAQKMEAVGQLTGGVAHDLNNLLTVILGNLELVNERVTTDAKSGAYLGSAIKAATRGARLIDQLLAFSRRAVLTPEALRIERVIGGIEDMIRRSLPETIEFATEFAPASWTALLDRNQLENAILNLALNARDAMPDGGVLTIMTSNVTLNRSDCDSIKATSDKHDDALSPGRYVVVRATDTGAGMSAEVLSHAFEPFFTTKPVGKGTGLGLSMVYGFMKQSGGHALIESVEGAGTAVTLYFPADCSADATESDAPSDHTPNARADEKVLVVEDDAAVRQVIVAQLQRLGYAIGAAEHGGQAIAMLEEDPGYALLLTDLVMPGGWTGTALAEQAQSLRPGLCVLYMSGYTSIEAAGHGVLADKDATLLTKPIRRTCLAQAVRTALDAQSQGPAGD